MWVGVPEGGGSGRAGGWLLLLLLLLLLASRADSEKNKFYHMQTLCKNHFLQQQYRKTDGAVLRSQNEPNLECVLTFQTHTILQRFMLRFDLLQLDCNDHLYIYDGAHAVGSYKSDLSCRNTKQSVGAVFTRTNFVTLKYVTDAWGTENNGFKLIITAIKDPKHACKDFTCKVQEFCISPDLLCDDVNHCGDNSDEAGSDKCPPGHEMGTILGLGMPIFLVLTVGLILIVCISCVGCIFCVCRRLRGSNRRPQAQQANSDYPYARVERGRRRLQQHHPGGAIFGRFGHPSAFSATDGLQLLRDGGHHGEAASPPPGGTASFIPAVGKPASPCGPRVQQQQRILGQPHHLPGRVRAAGSDGELPSNQKDEWFV
ncbi:uncharacterized protein loaf isoform X2 [Cloeon dipterum]|uniref:uncharacterized protein loaf isoform X2 n=1 Tax=Cloeon dipterum TaxID=197152 RepID=UPI0032202D48